MIFTHYIAISMEFIKIIFFAVLSFFHNEEGLILADKATVTIHPKTRQIEIIQDGLFTIIETDEDKILVLKQWEKLLLWEENKLVWTRELDSFPIKNFYISPSKDKIQTHFILKYSVEKDLSAMGIWYDAEKNQFSINQIPQYNIKTESGKLEGNYWYFQGDDSFSFTIQSFLDMPEKYRNLKLPIEKLLTKNKEE